MKTMTPLSEAPIYDYPIDMLRGMVETLDHCNEGFLSDKTIPQLINIYHCWMRCGWDIYPDEWETKQVKEAMRGICPDWIETRTELKPVYHADRAETRKITAVSFVEHGGDA